MMMAKGLFYMIRNGDTARDAALAALEREPRSIKAQITVAGFLLNAPPMAGGDTEQARLVLERALAQEPASRNDRFLILGWLAQASFNLDDNDAAEQYFAEAFAIYPDSEWLLEIGDEILD
jgi:tetratricopeptide (TPR) repeat protein